MTANELRIGNWVIRKSTGDYHKVESIHATRIFIDVYGDKDITDSIDRKTGIHNNSILPIPLTPEILEKAGFEKGKHIYIKGADLLALKDGYYYGFTDNEYGFDLENSTKIIYLHQLQNLYFALTGEELNIEL